MALVKWLFVGLVAVLVSSSILYFINEQVSVDVSSTVKMQRLITRFEDLSAAKPTPWDIANALTDNARGVVV